MYPHNEKSYTYTEPPGFDRFKKLIEEGVTIVMEVVIGDGSSIKLPKASLTFKNQWKEIPQSHQEQYKALWTYDLRGSLDPLYEVKAQVSLKDWVLNKYTKIVAKAYKVLKKFPKLQKPLEDFFGKIKRAWTSFKNKVKSALATDKWVDRVEGDFDLVGSISASPRIDIASYRTLNSYINKEGPDGYVVGAGSTNIFVAELGANAKFVIKTGIANQKENGFELGGSIQFCFVNILRYFIENNTLYFEIGISNLEFGYKKKVDIKMEDMEDFVGDW